MLYYRVFERIKWEYLLLILIIRMAYYIYYLAIVSPSKFSKLASLSGGPQDSDGYLKSSSLIYIKVFAKVRVKYFLHERSVTKLLSFGLNKNNCD